MVQVGRWRTRAGRAQRQAPPPGLAPALYRRQRRGVDAPGDAPLWLVRGGDEGADTLRLLGQVVLDAEDDAGGD